MCVVKPDPVVQSIKKTFRDNPFLSFENFNHSSSFCKASSYNKHVGI